MQRKAGDLLQTDQLIVFFFFLTCLRLITFPVSRVDPYGTCRDLYPHRKAFLSNCQCSFLTDLLRLVDVLGTQEHQLLHALEGSACRRTREVVEP